MITLGIDPGLSGALCIAHGGQLHIHDMPTVTVQRGKGQKRDLDLAALTALLDDVWPMKPHAIVEQVGAMPGQGVTSMFSFGKSFGATLGILAALRIPVTLVPPAKWKRALQVPQGKDAARYRASQIFPDAADQWRLKKHDGRAEAALLTEYGRRILQQEGKANGPL